MQSINPVFIIVLAGVFAALWTRLGDRQPSTPVKFALGTILMGVAFLLFLPMAAGRRTPCRCSAWSAILLVFTLAELLISPVGLSVATKLAPRSSTPRWWRCSSSPSRSAPRCPAARRLLRRRRRAAVLPVDRSRLGRHRTRRPCAGEAHPGPDVRGALSEGGRVGRMSGRMQVPGPDERTLEVLTGGDDDGSCPALPRRLAVRGRPVDSC